jgi:phosphoribosylformylglycinamidine synthase
LWAASGARAVALPSSRGLTPARLGSFADVFGSAKGWGGAAKFNAAVWAQLQAFVARPDTFSLGVCNGCQLMAVLGLVPCVDDAKRAQVQPRFVHNASGRFESRFTSVLIQVRCASKRRGG